MVDFDEIEKRRSLIQTLYYQGESQRGIARQIGISQPAVRKHLLALGLLYKKGEDKVDGEDMLFKLKDGLCVMITTWKEASWNVDNYIARCRNCDGFFVTSRRGQIYCCNPCASGKPCSCGADKRTRVVIT
ncbi:MAG: hypothetical protein ACUVUQ_09485 [Thermodesulfovibrionales bacterium]